MLIPENDELLFLLLLFFIDRLSPLSGLLMILLLNYYTFIYAIASLLLLLKLPLFLLLLLFLKVSRSDPP